MLTIIWFLGLQLYYILHWTYITYFALIVAMICGIEMMALVSINYFSIGHPDKWYFLKSQSQAGEDLCRVCTKGCAVTQVTNLAGRVGKANCSPYHSASMEKVFQVPLVLVDVSGVITSLLIIIIIIWWIPVVGAED